MIGHNPYFQNYPQTNQNNLGGLRPQGNAPRDDRLYVSNQQAAESYLCAANSIVTLWDASQQRFYEKSTDCTGRPMAMRIFEYKEVNAMPEAPGTEYVSTKEFAEFKEQVNDFIKSFEVKEVRKSAKQSNATNTDS